jgi:hypothetical protein
VFEVPQYLGQFNTNYIISKMLKIWDFFFSKYFKIKFDGIFGNISFFEMKFSNSKEKNN